MSLWLLLTINSIALAGLLFLLAAGFSLIFGLMRIPNLAHGSFFMLGAYVGASLLLKGWSFWIAALVAAGAIALLGGVIERLILHRIAGKPLAQVLVTLGLSFMIADACLMIWSGDPIPLAPPDFLQHAVPVFGFFFPAYRLAVVGVAALVAVLLWLLLDRTRIGAMVRAGVEDPGMARLVGIRVARLSTALFCLGAALAGFAGLMAGPILSVYPGLDSDMLPLALVVVILGGVGSLPGALVGSLVIGLLYNFGQVLFPQLAYVVIFLPMLLILVWRPQGLFGSAP